LRETPRAFAKPEVASDPQKGPSPSFRRARKDAGGLAQNLGNGVAGPLNLRLIRATLRSPESP